MSGKFQPINRDTAYLLPPSLQDWLPEKHLARFVVDIVDQLDLSALVKRYGGGGKQPYHPSVLLALLFYGYATGIFSSRKLEQATQRRQKSSDFVRSFSEFDSRAAGRRSESTMERQ
jgi:transposase